MKKKNMLIILTVLLMAFMMTACGSSGAADEDTNDSGGGDGNYSFDVADFSFSDDLSTLTFDMVLDNQTDDSVVPAELVEVKATQDGAELDIPDDSLDGPAFGGTATKYEITVTLASDSPVTVEVVSLDDGSVLASHDVSVE